MFQTAFSATLIVLAISSYASAADEPPLTIAVSQVGRFAKGGSWYVSVNSAGKADLTIDANIRSQTDRVQRQFDLTQEQLAEFRKALDDESFFELENKLGVIVPDAGMTTLTVVRGSHVHTVKIHSLMNWVIANDKAKLRDPSRAVRLLLLVRSWFNDPEAVDSRRSYERVIQVAE